VYRISLSCGSLGRSRPEEQCKQHQNAGGTGGGSSRRTRGADAFLKLSKQLKEAGETELRKELHKAVRQTAKPLLPKVKASARENLPTRGGMNVHYSRKPIRAQARTGAKTAGVRVVMPKTDPRVDAEGRIYHPVFGRKGKGVVQTVESAKGFFSGAITDDAPQIRENLIAVLEDYAKRLAAKAQ